MSERNETSERIARRARRCALAGGRAGGPAAAAGIGLPGIELSAIRSEVSFQNDIGQ